MNAPNYINVYIGKVYRYDKMPKYFTKEMVITLMTGYAKQKTNEFPYTYIDFINLLSKINQSKEAIEQLENDLQKAQAKIDMLTDGMDTIYHLFREVENDVIIELRKEIDRLQNESKMARSLCNAIEHDRVNTIKKLVDANKTIYELRGQLNYEQNKTQ